MLEGLGLEHLFDHSHELTPKEKAIWMLIYRIHVAELLARDAFTKGAYMLGVEGRKIMLKEKKTCFGRSKLHRIIESEKNFEILNNTGLKNHFGMLKNLVFPRIFLHCVALGFIVSGLLLKHNWRFDSARGYQYKTLEFSTVSRVFSHLKSLKTMTLAFELSFAKM